MKIIRPDEGQYRTFLESSKRWFYQQSAESLAAVKAAGTEAELVALEDDGRIKLAGKVVYLRYKRFFKSAEMYFAPIFDDKQPELLEIFLKLFTAELKSRPEVLRFRVAPIIIRRNISDDGSCDENPAASDYDRIFKAQGFRRLDLDYHDAAGIQARFLFVKDMAGMDEEELFGSMAVSCRNNMRKAEHFGVKVRFLGKDEVDIFNKLLKATIERTGMPEYVCNFLTPEDVEAYGDLMRLPLAYMECDDSLAGLKGEEETLLKEAEEIEAQDQISRRMQTRLKQISAAVDSCRKRADKVAALKEKYGNVIHMACSQFIFSKSDCAYLQSAAYGEFMSMVPVYAIHHVMMKEAVKRQCDFYNFFAVSDPAEEDGDDASVREFKQQFKGYISEFLGTYECAVSPLMKFLGK